MKQAIRYGTMSACWGAALYPTLSYHPLPSNSQHTSVPFLYWCLCPTFLPFVVLLADFLFINQFSGQAWSLLWSSLCPWAELDWFLLLCLRSSLNHIVRILLYIFLLAWDYFQVLVSSQDVIFKRAGTIPWLSLYLEHLVQFLTLWRCTPK